MASSSDPQFGDPSHLKILPRNECGNIAQNTLKILQDGFYHIRGGTRIELSDDIAYSVKNTELYTEDDLQNEKRLISTIDNAESSSATTETPTYPKFEAIHCTTLQAAQVLAAQMKENDVGVLNFASAKNPGGGFLKGSKAQEESLARSSSLFPALTQTRIFQGFYDYNRRGKGGVYSNRLIYTPRVTIFKDDNGHLLSAPYHVGMITCPAPNAGVARDPAKVREALVERIRRILLVFRMHKHTTLVLGAFGCGVFKNDPFEVAFLFRQHLESEEFEHCFQRVVFAVLDERMCQIFRQVFEAPHLNELQRQMGTLTVQENRTNASRRRREKPRREPKRVDRFADDDNDDYTND